MTKLWLKGIPIVSYQPDLCKKDFCITNRLGLSRCLKSYEELEKILNGTMDWRPTERLKDTAVLV